MGPLISLVEKSVALFASLPKPVQTLGLALLGVAAAAGPVMSIGGRLLELFGMIARVLGIGAASTAAGGGLTGAVAGFGAAMSALVVPAALAGIAYGVKQVWDAWSGLNKAMGEGRAWEYLTKQDNTTLPRRMMGFDFRETMPSLPSAPRLPGQPTTPQAKPLPIDWMTDRSGPAMIADYQAKTAGFRKEIADLSTKTRNDLTRAIADNVMNQEEMVKEFGVSSGALKMFENSLTKTKDAHDDAAAKAKEHVSAIFEFNRAVQDQTYQFGQQFRAWRLASQEQRNLYLPEYLTFIDTSTDAWARNQKALEGNVGAQRFVQREQEKTSKMLDIAAERIENQEFALQDFARAAQRMGREIGGSAGRVISEVSNVVGAYDQLSKATEAMVTSGTASWGQYAAMATNWAGLIIGGLTSVVSWLERNDDNIRARIDYINSQGGQSGLRNRALSAGVPRAAERLINASAGAIPQVMERVNAQMEEAEERLQRYGLTWRNLGIDVRQSNVNEMTRQLSTDWRALSLQVEDATGLMRDSLSELVITAVDTGTQIPAAIAPLIEQLIRSGQLTEDAAAALLGLRDTGVPALADIEAAAGRYGISLDALGPKVGQLRINEAAAQIAEDFELLIGLGGDSAQILEKMSGKVQEVVTRALELGLEIPANMKPVIDKMLEAGLLTDEFGNKLTDASRLNFAEVLAEKVDELITKLGELIDKFSEVGSAAEEMARRRREALGQSAPTGPMPGETSPAEPRQSGPASGGMGAQNTGIGGGGAAGGRIGDVYIDGQRAGQLLTPHVGSALRDAGVV